MAEKANISRNLVSANVLKFYENLLQGIMNIQI